MKSIIDREFHLVIYGASGFTGKLVVEYLLDKYGPPSEALSYAIAGRSESKLKEVANELKNPKIPIIVADSSNFAAL
jgi:short subunit dehydrogenase-like uncharacterized protein